MELARIVARALLETPDDIHSPNPKPRLSGAFLRAGDGARTHDPQLGKLMLYQLSYARVGYRV